MNKAIGIIGAGRLGGVLAKNLKAAGCVLTGLTCADAEESRTTAHRLGIPPFADNRALCEASEVVFITVPDRLIVETAAELLGGQVRTGTLFIHCSGALSAFDLPPDERIIRGSFHPLQSFAGDNRDLAGIHIALDGEETAMPFLHELCGLTGGSPLHIPRGERPLYHAAACLASNHIVALLSAVQSLFMRWTDRPEEAQAAFWPLLHGTLDNFKRLGPGKALTGPIARGDAETVERHLAVLPEEYRDFYIALGLQALRIAPTHSALDEKKAEILEKILKQRCNHGQ